MRLNQRSGYLKLVKFHCRCFSGETDTEISAKDAGQHSARSRCLRYYVGQVCASYETSSPTNRFTHFLPGDIISQRGPERHNGHADSYSRWNQSVVTLPVIGWDKECVDSWSQEHHPLSTKKPARETNVKLIQTKQGSSDFKKKKCFIICVCACVYLMSTGEYSRPMMGVTLMPISILRSMSSRPRVVYFTSR